MKKNIIYLLLLSVNIIYGQETKNETNTHAGEFSFGARTTGSLFSSSGNYLGIGAGGQIRYRVDEKLNTEWFGDWMATDVGGLGQRHDAHIGESMIIYPGKQSGRKNSFTPYVIGGFCGDYTIIETNLYFDAGQNEYLKVSKDRWSFATQLGLGTHYNITEKFDVSFTAQYMIHFGSDIDADILTDNNGQKYLQIHQGKENALEGHLLFTISANFVIVDFRKNK